MSMICFSQNSTKTPSAPKIWKVEEGCEQGGLPFKEWIISVEGEENNPMELNPSPERNVSASCTFRKKTELHCTQD